MRGSLYDRYQLSNSTAIPQYQGSAGKEFIQVGDYMQGKYDQNLGQAMALNSGLENLDTQLPQDKKIADDLRDHYGTKLKELSQSGDWENMMPQVTQMGSEFANRYRELVAPMQERAEWRKNNIDNKDNNLTSYQKDALLAMADSQYKGLQKGPNGKLVGQYTGTDVDKNVDIPKWVREVGAPIVAQKTGGEYYQGQDGEWLTKTGRKITSVDAKRIQGVLSESMAASPEIQGHINQEGRIAGFYGARAKALPEGDLKKAAENISAKYGIPVNQAYGMVAEENTKQKLTNHIMNIGVGTFAHKDVENTIDMNFNQLSAEKRKDLKDFTPTFIQGANAKTTNDERDPIKLGQIAEDFKTQSADIQSKIDRLSSDLNKPNLSPEERTQLNSDLNNAVIKKQSIDDGTKRSNDILNYSKMRTAQNMGYSNYDEFLQSQSKDLLPQIKKELPTGLVSRSGVKITADDIAKGILDGRVKPKFISAGYGTTVSALDMTLPNGHKVSIPAGDKGVQIYNIMKNAQDGKVSRLKEFNDQWKTQHASNVENYSVQDNVMTLDDARSKDFTNALKAASDGVKFKKVGSYEELPEGDRPADYHVTGLGTPGPNGEARLMVEELDKNGKPTGNKYEANALNSNINEKTARFLGKQPTPEARQGAAMFTTGSPSTMLKGQPLGARIPIGQGTIDGKEVTAHIVVSGTEGDPEYNLTDEKGNVIHTTKSIGTAGQWIKTIKDAQ